MIFLVHKAFPITRIFTLTTLLSILIISSCTILFGQTAGSRSLQSLTILYTSGTNGYLEECPCSKDGLGGLARRQTVLKTSASGNTLIVDSGNLFSSYQKNQQQDRFIAKVTLLMNYSVMNLGEQDFTYGLDFWRKNSTNLNPVSANLRDSLGKRLTPPFQLFSFEGLRVAVTGITSESAFMLLPDDIRSELSIIPDEEELNETLFHLKNERPDIIILLLRSLDFEIEKKIAKRFPQIHLIISTDEQIAKLSPKRYGNTVVLSSGSEGEKVGKCSLVFDPSSNKILTIKNELIALSKKIPKDSEIDSMIQIFNSSQIFNK